MYAFDPFNTLGSDIFHNLSAGYDAEHIFVFIILSIAGFDSTDGKCKWR